jgi:hypothetical protein
MGVSFFLLVPITHFQTLKLCKTYPTKLLTATISCAIVQSVTQHLGCYPENQLLSPVQSSPDSVGKTLLESRQRG